MNIPIWTGTSAFSPGETPFGFYDDDSDFREDADKVADWCVKRLGYPLVDIELQQINFYTCFEESVNEYGAQLYNFQIINNFAKLIGKPTGSTLNNVHVTSPTTIQTDNDYGNYAVGGSSLKVESGSLYVRKGKQTYDLLTDASSSVSGSEASAVKIKKIYHYAPSAINRYFDPYAGTGTGIQSLMQAFGFGNYSPGVNFMLMPLYFDVLKLQAIEFNDQIRKSAYHFEINGHRYLRLFPIPKNDYTLWFDYTINLETSDPIIDPVSGESASLSNVTDLSNAPYTHPTYLYINDPGRQWIRKYTLALAKEMLGGIRGKYQTVPIPGAETTLDYGRLLSEAESEKTALIDELRADLLETTRVKQLERSNTESDLTQENYTKMPYQIYIG